MILAIHFQKSALLLIALAMPTILDDNLLIILGLATVRILIIRLVLSLSIEVSCATHLAAAVHVRVGVRIRSVLLLILYEFVHVFVVFLSYFVVESCVYLTFEVLLVWKRIEATLERLLLG